MKKIFWNEGLLLRQQHLQLNDKLMFESMGRMINLISSYSWGFKELEISEHALKFGKIEIEKCSGYFQDGMYFSSYTDNDISIDVPDDTYDSIVYLCISKYTKVNQEPSGVKLVECRIDDLYSITDNPEPINILTNNLILSIGSPASNCYSLPVCVIKKCQSDKKVILDANFLPPYIYLENSKYLVSTIKNLISIVSDKIVNLTSYFQSNEITSKKGFQYFKQLEVYNEHLLKFQHMLQSKDSTPMIAYVALTELIVSLSSSLLLDSTHFIGNLDYKHDQQFNTFNHLLMKLHEVINASVEDRYESICIDKKSSLNYEFKVGSDTKEIILQVSFLKNTHTTDADIFHDSNNIKIGFQNKIKDIVNFQLPGMEFLKLERAPIGFKDIEDSIYLKIKAPTNKIDKKVMSYSLYKTGADSIDSINGWALK